MTKALPTVAAYLLRAKGLLDTPDKWCKNQFWTTTFVDYGQYKEYKEAFCALGAVARSSASNGYVDYVGGKLTYSQRAASYLQQAITELYSKFMPGLLTSSITLITWFNDHEDTTHVMVMNAFDRAIELAMKDNR